MSQSVPLTSAFSVLSLCLPQLRSIRPWESSDRWTSFEKESLLPHNYNIVSRIKENSKEFSKWESSEPLKKEMATPPVFLPGESHGQRSMAGYSPRGYKESDTTQVT